VHRSSQKWPDVLPQDSDMQRIGNSRRMRRRSAGLQKPVCWNGGTPQGGSATPGRDRGAICCDACAVAPQRVLR
jgi:hypothetical protein